MKRRTNPLNSPSTPSSSTSTRDPASAPIGAERSPELADGGWIEGFTTRAILTQLAADLGYWLRPYDPIADRRRWAWRRPAPCGRHPDGWAMSCSTPSLRTILPMCPPDVRVTAWTKPFAAYKRNVRIAYTWEPVIVWRGRISSKDGAMVNRDHLAEPIVMRKGFTGTKPERFCRWVLDLLGWKPGDKVDDLFVGTGVFGRVLLAAEASPEVCLSALIAACRTTLRLALVKPLSVLAANPFFSGRAVISREPEIRHSSLDVER